MTKKKRGTVWDGVRDAYNAHEALELLAQIRGSGERFFEEAREIIMMVAALSAVIGLFYFFG